MSTGINIRRALSQGIMLSLFLIRKSRRETVAIFSEIAYAVSFSSNTSKTGITAEREFIPLSVFQSFINDFLQPSNVFLYFSRTWALRFPSSLFAMPAGINSLIVTVEPVSVSSPIYVTASLSLESELPTRYLPDSRVLRGKNSISETESLSNPQFAQTLP